MLDTPTAPTVTRFSFPSHIAPESITRDREYVVMVRSPSGIMSFIGPFVPRSELTPYDEHDFFFRGNFRLTGEFPSGKFGHIVIPKAGRAEILYARYALYEWSEEFASLMERVKESQQSDEREKGRVDPDEKY